LERCKVSPMTNPAAMRMKRKRAGRFMNDVLTLERIEKNGKHRQRVK